MEHNKSMSDKYLGFSPHLPFSIGWTLLLWLIPGLTASMEGAEKVIVERDGFRQSVTVEELKNIADEGIIPISLRSYAQSLTLLQKAKIRDALKVNLPISSKQIEGFLSTEFGGRMVNLFASATPAPDGNSQAAVVQALYEGSKAPEGLSIISFIQAYPQSNLEIDLERILRILGNFNAAFWQTQAFMAEITPQLEVETPQLDLPFDPTQPGEYEVQTTDYLWLDEGRDRFSAALRAEHEVLPTGDRLIPVTLYQSTGATVDKPLVVFSHGLGSVNYDLRYLAQHLASHGYVVAALEHPGSNETHIKEGIWQWLTDDVPIIKPEEFLERPRDVSFVLDKLATLNQSDEFLQGKLATDNVLIVGYSLGGSTALTVAGGELQIDYLRERCPKLTLVFSLGENAQCFAKDLPEDSYQLRDERIKAAIALSPTTSLLFGDTGLEKIAVPTLIAASSADKTTPALTEQVVAFERILQPKWLAAFVSGTHLSVKDPSTTTDQITNPDTIYTGGEVVGDEAVEVRDYVKAITLAMAAQLTDQGEEYQVFLTPTYAASASTARLPIRLVTEIPEEAKAIIEDILAEGDEPQTDLR